MKPWASTPHVRKSRSLLLDEMGQAVAVAAIGDCLEEGFEVVPNGGVENGLVGVARLIRAVGMSHPLG
jgi:hypothetical protein